MDWFVKAFVKASVAWLAVGVILGMSMALVPAWTVYRAMHVHVLLLGFVTMFISGVAYHVVTPGGTITTIRALVFGLRVGRRGAAPLPVRTAAPPLPLQSLRRSG